MISKIIVLCLHLSIAVNAANPVSFSVSDYRDLDSGLTKKTDNKACSSFSTRITMIEHFFTLIYNEFEGSPPVCVCVQMCESQPLFCYPNGCLRRDTSFSGNNIKLKFDIATFPPPQDRLENKFDDTNRYNPRKFDNNMYAKFYENKYKFDDKHVAVTESNNIRNILVKPVGNEQLLPIDLKYFDKKFKSLVKSPPRTSRLMDIPRNDRYTVIRTDAAGKYLTEEEYQAAEDQFRRHIQVSP